jgi:glycosyltransferase involved in cell wall biosynthesis
MSKIRILAIPSDSHGVGKFRIMDPFTYIGDNFSSEVHVDLVFDVPNQDDYFLNYDIVVLHSFIHKSHHENTVKRIKWLKENGIKVVVDTDDFWKTDHRHPNHETFKKNNLAQKRSELLRLADYITTTTPIYRDTIKRLLGVNNVEVFPNAINEEEKQFQPKPIKSDLVRFGWLGGSSHEHDLSLMADGISKTHTLYKGKVQFVLCGFDLRGTMRELNRQTGQVHERPIRPEETSWSKYESMFTNNNKSLSPEYLTYLKKYNETPFEGEFDQPYVRRWTMDINKYANNYNLFDVSLAPLVKSEFNGNKSQLKVIEAGFHKKALIASEENPYLIDLISSVEKGGSSNPNGNALLVSSSKNHKQWNQHMKRLITNPNLITDLGEKLYETVKDKYSLSTVSKNRVEFFKSIINKNQ